MNFKGAGVNVADFKTEVYYLGNNLQKNVCLWVVYYCVYTLFTLQSEYDTFNIVYEKIFQHGTIKLRQHETHQLQTSIACVFFRSFTGDWFCLFLITLNGGVCCRNAGITRQPAWRAIHTVFYAQLLSDSPVTDLCFVSNLVISVTVK